jgi:hypothetical protein
LANALTSVSAARAMSTLRMKPTRAGREHPLPASMSAQPSSFMRSSRPRVHASNGDAAREAPNGPSGAAIRGPTAIAAPAHWGLAVSGDAPPAGSNRLSPRRSLGRLAIGPGPSAKLSVGSRPVDPPSVPFLIGCRPWLNPWDCSRHVHSKPMCHRDGATGSWPRPYLARPLPRCM